jgi:hypothetical protein
MKGSWTNEAGLLLRDLFLGTTPSHPASLLPIVFYLQSREGFEGNRAAERLQSKESLGLSKATRYSFRYSDRITLGG